MSKKKITQVASSPTNPYGLTGLQWRLVQEYPLHDFNGTKAAIAAGYKGKRPDVWASQTLRKPKVREAMMSELEESTKYYSLTRDRVIQEWMSIAFFNIKDIGDNPGEGFNFDKFSELPNSTVAAIESVDHAIGKDGTIRMGVKTAKIKGLTMLTKLLGMMEPAAREDGKGAFMKWLEDQQRIDEEEDEDEERESKGEEPAEGND